MAADLEQLISTSRHAVVVGVGNVALDVARVLVKTVDQLDDTDMADEVLDSLLVRASPTFTCSAAAGLRTQPSPPKSCVSLASCADVDVIVDPADLELDPSSQAVVDQNKVAARNLAVLQDWAARPLSGASRRITFHFWTGRP